MERKKHISAFAKNLRFLRRMKGLTQNQLAQAIEINRNKITSYEAGFAQPNLITLCSLAQHLDVPLGRLISQSLDPDSLQITLREKHETSDHTESAQLDISKYIQATNEVQKIYDALVVLKEMEVDECQNNPKNELLAEAELLKLLAFLLENNWVFIKNLQNQ